MSAIKRIAGTDGYDLIVDRATVAFSRSDLDLTDRVIQLANGALGGSARARGLGRNKRARSPGARAGSLRQAVTWDGVVRLRGETLAALAARHGAG